MKALQAQCDDVTAAMLVHTQATDAQGDCCKLQAASRVTLLLLQANVAATSVRASLLPFTGAGRFVTSGMCWVQRSPAIQLEVGKLDVVHQQQAAMLLQLQLCVAAQVALNSHDGQAHTRIGFTQ